MSVCPFCKASSGPSQGHGPCPRCGRSAAEHPSIAGSGGRDLDDGFGDPLGDPLGGPDFELETGSSVGAAGGVSAYEGSGDMTFDDDLMGGGDSGPLELDMPASEPRGSGSHVVPQSTPRPAHPAPRISGSHPAASISGTQPAAAPVDAAPAPPAPPPPPAPTPRAPPSGPAIIANYPEPPAALWQLPGYALKVLLRQLQLREDLTSLRKRRSPDVPLYEAALQAHDKRAFAMGLGLTAAAVALGLLVLCIPLIVRALRGD